jgi:hypothetical protein
LAELLRMPLPPDLVVWKRFSKAYCGPFHDRFPDDPGGVVYLLEMAADRIFDCRTSSFRTASKGALFETFLKVIDDDDGLGRIAFTPEEAEAALNFLVEQEMVVVDGDAVSVHPRFAHLA